MRKKRKNLKSHLTMNKRLIAIACFLVFAGSAYAQVDNSVDKIVAVVGDKIVLKSEVENGYLQFIQEGGIDQGIKTKCTILENLMTNKLLITQAELDSVEVADEEIEGQLDRRIQYFTQMLGGQVEKLEEFYGKSVLELKEEFREPVKEQLLAQKMRSQITEDVKLTPKEVKDYFSKIPKDSLPYFETEIQAGQVVIFPQTTAAIRKYTIGKLDELRQRVVEQGESFSTLAILYSEDPGSQKQGGDLGWFKRGEMVSEFEANAFKLDPAEVSEVFETPFGFHIIQMIEKRGSRINVRHILVRPPVSDDQLLETRGKLDSIKSTILNGDMTFTQAVKKFSEDDDTKNNAGLFRNGNTGDNVFTISDLGQMPQNIYYYIKDLKPGEISAPIAYLSNDGKKGYRIIYLKSQSDPHIASLETDYEKIQAAAISTKKAKVITDWFDEHRTKTYIRLSDDYGSCPELDAWKSNN